MIVLAALPLLSGCSGFWDVTNDNSTTTTLSSGYFYLVDKTNVSLLSYHVVSGTLTLVGSYSLPASPVAVAVAPNGDYLCVSTTSGIYVYTLSAGVPTIGNSSSALITETTPPTALAIDTSSQWLVEASGNGSLTAIPVVPTTGALDSARTTQSVAMTGASVNQVAFAKNDAFVLVAAGGNGTYEYSFATSSSATPLGTSPSQTIATVNTAGAAQGVAVDPSDRMVYIAETDSVSSSGGLRVYSLNTSTGALTSVANYASGGSGPHQILPDLSGDYVYVTNWSGTSTGNVTGFSISATSSSYALTKIGSVSAGIEPTAIFEDDDKNFVFTVNQGGSDYLSGFIFDTTTSGQLDTVISDSSYASYAGVAQP